jgi:hypothetical protein
MKWQLRITRLREEVRGGVHRTVGTYQVFHDFDNGVRTMVLQGFTAEPGGPGDNQHQGDDRRLEAGTYPLKTHDGVKYVTIGYAAGTDHPRPAIEVGNTGNRVAILFHPARGFLSSIGCINAAGALPNVHADIDWADSRARVVAVIDDMRSFLGSDFPRNNGQLIPNAEIVFDGEPLVGQIPK